VLKHKASGEVKLKLKLKLNVLPRLPTCVAGVGAGGSLCLADVLVDDVAGDRVHLSLLPHEQHTLVDEDVLLLVDGRTQCRRGGGG